MGWSGLQLSLFVNPSPLPSPLCLLNSLVGFPHGSKIAAAAPGLTWAAQTILSKNEFLFLQPSNKSHGLHTDLTNLGQMHSTELLNANREKCYELTG